MPKAARKRSASGYYHVVPKGIAWQTVFGDDQDRHMYLKWLAEAKDEAIRLAADVLGRDPRKGCTTEEAHLLLAHDFNVRQVERITGVSRYRLQKAS